MDRTDRAPRLCLIVPCFDEQDRLRPDRLRALVAADPGVAVVLVDDGSRDATLTLLRELRDEEERISAVALDRHMGKGEAVRIGLRQALGTGSEWVGYVDADLSTPVEEIRRLAAIAADRSDIDVVIGSRVALAGRSVTRSPRRHYPGRVFATLARAVLGTPVYDTQCGAKLLRSTDALRHSLSQPFRSRWAFDVELLGRLGREGVPDAAFWEEPLLEWHDAPGSRRSLASDLRATWDLWPIRRDLRRWRPR